MQKWKRVQGFLIARTEAMQLCIEAELEERKSNLAEKYKKSLEKLDEKPRKRSGGTSSDPTADADTDEVERKPEGGSTGRRKEPTFLCNGMGCRWKRMQEGIAAKGTLVHTKNTRCPHCVVLVKGIEYAIKVEEVLVKSPIGISSITDMEAEKVNGTQLRKISEICYELVPTKVPEPNTNRARKLIQEPLRYMARRIANTLLIDLHSTCAGFNATILEDESSALRRRAAMICRGECESDSNGENNRQDEADEEEDGIAKICKRCGHLQRKNEA